MASKKRARKDDSILVNPIKEDSIQRKGVTWRKNPTKCVVEMRPPNWQWKLNFGSYDTEAEAMFARDYGAHLRNSAGEVGADAGGFDADDKLYQFEESHDVFESMKETKVRRDEYKSLLPQYQQLKNLSRDGIPPHREFSKKARKDIAIAIEMFREKYPHKLVTSRPTETTEDLPKVKLIDGEIQSTPSSSNSEVRVPPEPTPGRESEAVAGDSSDGLMSALFAVVVDDSILGTRCMSVPRLTKEQILKIIVPGFDKIFMEILDKWLAELDRCSFNPSDIVPILKE